MSECIDHMDAYTNLTDSIFHLILMSEIDNEHMKRAQEILNNIQRRRLYKCVGVSVPITEANILKKNVSNRILILSQIKKDILCASDKICYVHLIKF